MFNIRDCIKDPLYNVIPSEIDIIYYNEMRKFINNNVTDFLSTLNLNGKRIVDIGLTGHVKKIDNAILDTIDIDPNNNPTYLCDITKNNSDKIKDNIYDIVICTEVLEHTNNPINAINELNRMTKKDGLIIITTPYNFRIHGPLYDTFRMSDWFYKNYFKNDFEIVNFLALEDNNRKLCPISYFLVIKKLID